MASLNINSLLTHIDELRVFLSNNKLDVLAINETKLDDSIPDVELYIYGYDLIRRDRNRNGGGVCFFVKSSINYTIRLDLRLKSWKTSVLKYIKPVAIPY
jgi:exonuclease III